MKLISLVLGGCLLASSCAYAAEKTTLRIGIQASGTLEWELSAIADDPDFALQVTPLATAEAGKIALQSGSVDMIVSDWIWVSSLRATGNDVSFYPYSSAAGALVVAEDSPIHSIADLKGKRLGIAGGELDKNWLLLQALAQHQALDLNAAVTKTYGAPPLISEQLKQNRIDAALTYWHFAARLTAQGYRQVIDGKGILKGLGIAENMANIGYVFKQSWANAHKTAVNSFFKASKAAKNRLCTSDAAWQKVIPLLHTDDAPTQAKLRAGYCDGGITQWGAAEQQAAAQIYTLVRGVSGNRLTGASENVSTGTFWTLD